MTLIEVSEGESFEKALKRFKRAVEKEGIIAEVKRRQFYEKPSEKKKRKERASRKRIIKALKKKNLI
ncbi:MAG: 30S ribosomal protein S21 [Aquificaceae bacterium]|nr:30S ribosomal protein S21 [Aquificaceae bacterium]MDW8237413.1 30S ribosomal protein S21 [Aquificaceae bacterium]